MNLYLLINLVAKLLLCIYLVDICLPVIDIAVAKIPGRQGAGWDESNRPSGERHSLERNDRLSGATTTMNGVGSRGVFEDDGLHLYIAAMQLFPIKLNLSFIKNADMKVQVALAWPMSWVDEILTAYQA